MNRIVGVGCCALALLVSLPVEGREDRRTVFTFEDAEPLGAGRSWGGGPLPTLSIDKAIFHGGTASGSIVRSAESPQPFSSLTLGLPVDFTGKKLELRAWLKYEGVTEWVGLWQRQDSNGGVLQFDNMQSRGLKGTADWVEHSVVLPLDPHARHVYIGALLAGPGRLWVDDVQLLVDGVPLNDVPEVVRVKRPAEMDTMFDAGSGVALAAPSEVQARNLVTLGQVWGYLKYHHPRVAAGELNWDYELFRVLPRVLAAGSAAAAADSMERWVAAIGDPPPCDSCVTTPKGAALLPRLDWLEDASRLGAALSARLRRIHARRPKLDEHWYVRRTAFVGNPDFDHERGYRELTSVDPGFRLLALFRFWNIIEYCSPYRDLIQEPWDGVLAEYVPRVLDAADRHDYTLELMALVARVHDSHTNLWSAMEQRPPSGPGRMPVALRMAEGRPVVCAWTDSTRGPVSGLERGDAILALDDVPVDTLFARWRPYHGASNSAPQLRDLCRSLVRGDTVPVRVRVLRAGRTRELTVARHAIGSAPREAWDHVQPGPSFRRLSPDVAYLKMSTVTESSVDECMRGAQGARCLVVDLRSYPAAFLVFRLGGHLVTNPTQFVKFTTIDLNHPGAFAFGAPLAVPPLTPTFAGRVVVLVDEVTQSSAEYHAMAFRAAPGAIVVGSTTAGADGNVSEIPLPGGLRTMISGIGVYYPDGRPTQRVGIIPDHVVHPTMAGIREGRDEVLEAGIQLALGRELTAAEHAAVRIPRLATAAGRTKAAQGR